MAISDRRGLDGESLVEWARRVAEAGVDTVQLREKDLSDRAVYDLACHLRDLLPRTTRLIVNGRADIAAAAGADGVHLPVAELDVAVVRRHWGGRLLIGCSTHDLEEIEGAVSGGADYVTFGPLFPTPSKPGHQGHGLEALSTARARFELPIVALGGVGLEDLRDVAAVGATGVAAIRLFLAEDLASVVTTAEEVFG